MPFGRGWFGYGGGWGRGWGRGNPYPRCRFHSWLPGRWWAMPYAGQYGPIIPYMMGYGHPYYNAGYMAPYGYPGYGIGYTATVV